MTIPQDIVSHSSLIATAGIATAGWIPTIPEPQRHASDRIARDLYHQYFDVLVGSGEDLRTAAFRLRYQVYCVENDYEAAAENPGGLEQDGYDERSIQCVLRHKRSGDWAGTVRLVLPDPTNPLHSFALQEVCNEPMILDASRFPILQMAEISRFCISRDFRKRLGDWLYPENTTPEDSEDEHRVIPNMTLGLIEGLVRMSLESKTLYWCALMERPLLRLLARLGIHFENIGPLVDHHGRRQPCFLQLETMLLRVHEERPDVWEILTDAGRHWDQLKMTLASAPTSNHRH